MLARGIIPPDRRRWIVSLLSDNEQKSVVAKAPRACVEAFVRNTWWSGGSCPDRSSAHAQSSRMFSDVLRNNEQSLWPCFNPYYDSKPCV